jgi:hypothetical protein
LPEFKTKRPESVEDEDAGRLHEWIKTQGIDVQGVQVRNDGDIIVRADGTTQEAIDALMSGYVRTETDAERERREAIDAAVAEIDAIGKKNPNARTPTEKVLLGMALASTEIRKAAVNAGTTHR